MDERPTWTDFDDKISYLKKKKRKGNSNFLTYLFNDKNSVSVCVCEREREREIMHVCLFRVVLLIKMVFIIKIPYLYFAVYCRKDIWNEIHLIIENLPIRHMSSLIMLTRPLIRPSPHLNID